MTTQQLRVELYKLNYPEYLEVDRETYENVHSDLMEWIGKQPDYGPEIISTRTIRYGKRGGLMFKNVELLVK